MKIPSDLTNHYQKNVSTTVHQVISSGSLPPTVTNFIVTTPQTSTIYFIPKIHKQDNPGHPIVSACNCPTELSTSTNFYPLL
uniref:Uncharacterized protein n=1 Tax=Octopus bimaculoides TaxID=37653 RepID=A0A0L8FJV7_OCTBM